MTLKLSICIPTYNRARLLGETLDGIIAQVVGLGQAGDGVEIAVSDNASPDDTEAVVRARQARFPRLTYFRQPENRGADRNYLQSVALARGEWCWLLGDDDPLEDDAVSTLLGYLNGPRPLDFVQLLVTAYDFDLKHVLQRSADVLGVTGDIYTTDVPGFFAHFFQESYLSEFVIRRDRWNAVDPEPYVGTGLTYLGITYEYLQADSPVLVVARPLIKYRSQNVSWMGSALEIILTHQRRVMDLLPARYDGVKEAAYAAYSTRTPVTLKMLCFLRAEGGYDANLYGRLLAPYFRGRPLHTAAARLIAHAPRPAMSLVRRAYKRLKAARHG